RSRLLAAGFLVVLGSALPFLGAQEGPVRTDPSVRPAVHVPQEPVMGKESEATPTATPEDLPPLARQFHLSAQRGAAWLYRMNGVKGRFLHGYLPAVQAPLEGDHYLRQACAA